MRWALTSFLLLLISTTPLSAKNPQYKDYYGRVTTVIDGDTIKADAYLTKHLVWKPSVRLRGIDAPELRGKCAEEKRRARAARDYLRSILSIGDEIWLRRVKVGKYAGRVIASVYYKSGKRWVNLSKQLLTAKHGRKYHGGKRKGWCE